MSGADGQGGEGPSPFDQQPPQDLTAEQPVLCRMPLREDAEDAVASVVEVLRPDDF